MSKNIKPIIALALFGIFSPTFTMEVDISDIVSEIESKESADEIELNVNETQTSAQNEKGYLDLTGGLPNELWIKILRNVLFDSNILRSKNIFEAIKRIEHSLGSLSCTCSLFSKIRDLWQNDVIEFYRVKLADTFLEYDRIFIGLKPIASSWGFDYELDQKLGQFLLNCINKQNIQNVNILPYAMDRMTCKTDEIKNICLLLLFFGANINACGGGCPMTTPLIWAIISQKKLVPMLLAKGANVYQNFYQNFFSGESREYSALDFLSSKKGDDKELAEILFISGPVISITALNNACIKGNTKIFHFFLAHKNNIIGYETWDKSRALILALKVSSEKKYKIAKTLLEEGTDSNACGENGETALMIACEQGCKEIVKMLLATSSNINDYNEKGETALMIASKEGCKEIVEMLLAASSDIDAREKAYGGTTPLMFACLFGHDAIVKLLLAKKNNVNIATSDGATALIGVLTFAQFARFSTKKNWQLRTKKIVEMLLRAGANVNVCAFGDTALIKAIRFVDPEVIEMLLRAGADIDLKNEEGHSVFDIAKLSLNHEKIIALLNHYQKKSSQSNNDYCLVS